MDKRLQVTYYLHSGFSCAMNGVLLIFDYWLGENQELAESKRITVDYLRRFDEVYVFISHSHPDHFDPVVYTWSKEVPVTYIVSYEMPVGTRGRRMSPGSEIRLTDRLTVRTFDSTDLGVSFYVTLDGVHIFHAGDLNFWHWREESTVQEIDEAEKAFHRACKPIIGQPIDIAFFPVDPRQGQLFDAGANYFIMAVKPRLLVPMHFWGRSEAMQKFARRERSRQTEIVAMVRPHEEMTLDFGEDGFMTISVAPPAWPTEAADRPDVALNGYDGEDPFGDTDLPVRMDSEP